MKSIMKFFPVLFLIFGLSANVHAQVETTDGDKSIDSPNATFLFDIQEKTQKMSEGEQTALYIYVEKADKRQAQKVWKDFMDQYNSKTKKGMFSSEFRTEKVHIYSVGGVDPVNVYATFDDDKNGAEGYIWFQLSDSEFLNSGKYKSAFHEAKRIVDNFGLALQQEVVRDELEKQEKVLADYESEMKKLQRENEKLNDTIDKAEKTIEKAQKDLELNAKDQESTLSKLKDQQKLVEEARVKYNAVLKQ